MELGTVFWLVIAYSFVMPFVIRFTALPLIALAIAKSVRNNGQEDYLPLPFLFLWSTALGVSVAVSGPWTWARAAQQLFTPGDQG